jgi:two-component system sensor histidine kinase RegB
VLLAALATLTCCGLLAFFHASMPALRDGAPDAYFTVFGIWAICVAAGSPIVYFFVMIAASLRRRRQPSDKAREAEASGKHLADFGTLAASIVHEIRSPLTTMAVLVKELLMGSSSESGQEVARNLRIMSDQIEACRRALSELTRSGEAAIVSERRADEFLDEVVAKWRVLRPDAALSFRKAGVEPPPGLFVDPSLRHAILNLLNNAAEAAPGEPVEMTCRWSTTTLRIVVADRGRGFPKELKDKLGRLPCSTKRAAGVGIGLLLARTSIEQCGGTLALSNKQRGGRVEVVLPAHRTRAIGPSTPDAGGEIEEQRNYRTCTG